MGVVVGTIGAAAAAGAAGAAKGGIWFAIKTAASKVGSFIVRHAGKIGMVAAVGGAALTGGSYSKGDMKISYNKGLLDKRNSGSAAQSNSTYTNSKQTNPSRASSTQSKPNNSKPAYNNSNQKSWSHSGTYKKRR